VIIYYQGKTLVSKKAPQLIAYRIFHAHKFLDFHQFSQLIKTNLYSERIRNA